MNEFQEAKLKRCCGDGDSCSQDFTAGRCLTEQRVGRGVALFAGPILPSLYTSPNADIGVLREALIAS